MRLHRFYIEEKLAGRNEIRVADEALLHQLKDVFRLEKGDKVIFFDGEGMDVTCKIEMISKKEAVFSRESETESIIPEQNVTLLMALIKKDNFELVLQKCTELSVSRFVPIMAERSEKKNIDMDRGRRIIKEASEQCGRGDLPELSEIKNLDEILDEKNLIVFDGSGRDFVSSKPQALSFKLLVGPEGGWSEKEIAKFKEKNIPIYSLGNLTLRAETAAIVACSQVLI